MISKLKRSFDGVLRELLVKVESFDNSKDIAYIDSCAGDHVWILDSSKSVSYTHLTLPTKRIV